VPVATASVVEGRDAGDAAEERARLGGEGVEEEVVYCRENELICSVRYGCAVSGRVYVRSRWSSR
jgi:hypothetical protein